MNAIDVNDIKSNASNINFSNYAPNYAASSGMIRSINTNIPCSNTCVSSYAAASNVENMNFDDIESIKQDKNILEEIKKSELVTGYDSKLEKLEKEKLEISSLIASKNAIITMPTYAASSNVYKYSDIEKLKAEVLELQKQLDVKNAEIKEVEQMKNATVNYLAEMYYKNLESNHDFQDNIKINLTEEEANQLSLIYSKLYEARVYDSSFNQILNKDNFCNYDIVRNLYENNPSLFDGIDWDIVKNAYDKGFNIYEVAMQSPSLMEESLEKSLFLAGDDFSFGNFLHLLNFMTDEEKNMVMYLYNTEGNASVENYLSFKQQEFNYREGYYNASKFLEDINNSGGAEAFLKTVGKGLGDGVGTFFEGLESALGGMDGVVSVKQAEAMYIISGMSEEQIDEMEIFSEEEKEKLKQLKGLNSNMFLQGTYEISSSIGNMIPSMAVSAAVSYVATPAAGAKVGATLMGISAGGNAAEGMYQQGHGFYESVFYGIMSGGSEMALGYLLGSIPGLSKGKEFVGDIAIDVAEEGTKKLFKETLKEIGKDILSEGGEEALQAIIDPYLQSIALGVEPEIDWNEVVKSGIYGMITAGMLNGGTVVYKGTKIKVENLMNNADVIKAAQDLGIKVDYLKVNNSDYINDLKNQINTGISSEVESDIARYDELLKIIETDDYKNYAYKKFNDYTIEINSEYEGIYSEFMGLKEKLSQNGNLSELIDLNFDYEKAINSGTFANSINKVGVNAENITKEVKKFSNVQDIAEYFGDPNLYLYGIFSDKVKKREISLPYDVVRSIKSGVCNGNVDSIQKILNMLESDQLLKYDSLVAKRDTSIHSIWLSKLTSIEKQSLRNYAENFGAIEAMEYDGIYDANGNSTISINDLIRAGIEEGNGFLDSAIEKFGLLPDEIITYRGVGLDALTSQFGQIDVENLDSLVGKVYADKAYMSSTLMEDKAKAAVGKPTDVILKINVPTDDNYGAFIESQSNLSYNQLEFLIKRNSTSLIENAYLNEEGKIVVEMRLFNSKQNNIDNVKKIQINDNPYNQNIVNLLNVSNDMISDMEYSIEQFMKKYNCTREEALNQIKALVEERNFSRMTSYGNARNILRKYSFEELIEIYNKISLLDNVSNNMINDMEYSIEQFMKKYNCTREEALNQIKALVEERNFSRMTSYGNARNILRKYSFEELDLIYTKVMLLNTESNVDSFNGYSYSEISDYFEGFGSSENLTYGVNQGCLYELFRFIYNGKEYSYRQAMKIVQNAISNGEVIPKFKKVGNNEYFRLKNKLISNYGFSQTEASIIISSVDDAGACSYADVCNVIFSSFKGKEIEFEKVFGYSMYRNVDGKLEFNSNELLLDLYVFANSSENGGTFILKDIYGRRYLNRNLLSSTKVDPLGRIILDANKQVYMSTSNEKNNEVIKRFLNSKSSNIYVDYSNVQLKEYFDNVTNEELKNILKNVKNYMERGAKISLGIFSTGEKINMISCDSSSYSSTSTKSWGEGGGHAVFVTGLTNDGFIVSSWGKKYIIPYKDLLNGGKWDMDCSLIQFF